MKPVNRVAINTGFLYARMAITVIISLYSTRIILEALGAKDFGIFNVVGGAILMLGFLNASMTEATQRFMSLARGNGSLKQLTQTFNASVILHLFIATALLILLESAGLLFFNYVLNISPERLEASKLVYQFMVISTVITVLTVPYDAAINARENMLIFAILGFIESILKLLVAINIAFISMDKLVYYGSSMAIITAILLIIRIIYCTKKYKECKIRIKKYYDKGLLRDMSQFAGWSLSSSATSMFAQYSQSIIINRFFGTTINASQGIANQVSGQLGVFAATMMKALNPVITKSEGAKNRAYMLKATMFGSKAAFFLLMIFIVPVLIEMPAILDLWLHEVPEYTIVFCRLLLLRDLLGQMFVPLKSSINAVGNIKKYNFVYSIITVLPIIVTFVLFTYGLPPETLYYVFLVYEISICITILYFAKIKCELPILFFINEIFLKCIISFTVALILSMTPLLFTNAPLTQLISVILVSAFSCIGCIWKIGFSYEERKMIKTNLINIYTQVKSKLAPYQLSKKTA